ncbi:MAG: iron dependent repressor, metal binding and dimerization domain protein [Anaerolineae bacterium]
MPDIKTLRNSSNSGKGGPSHQAIEDYLKTIYRLAQEEFPVSTSRLAEAREVKPASVTGMIKRLSGLDLVNYQKHYGVTLTESGRKIALEVIRHHRLIETYLMEALGFEWDEVHEQADLLEHVISEKLEAKIAAYLNHPEFDPHGAPIPRMDGTVPHVQSRPLTTMMLNDQGEISQIRRDNDSAMLRELADCDLIPGTSLKVVEISADRENYIVQLTESGNTHKIGFDAADSILIKL